MRNPGEVSLGEDSSNPTDGMVRCILERRQIGGRRRLHRTLQMAPEQRETLTPFMSIITHVPPRLTSRNTSSAQSLSVLSR